jgi:hypothetical protein
LTSSFEALFSRDRAKARVWEGKMIETMVQLLSTFAIAIISIAVAVFGVRGANRFVDRQLMVKESRVKADQPIILQHKKSAGIAS